jgi:hypothetical protein
MCLGRPGRPDKIDHDGGKLKHTVEGMADAPILIQRELHPIRKLVMSLWGPRRILWRDVVE